MTLTHFVRNHVGFNGTYNRCPIEIVDGNVEPLIYGESWHYETRGGRRIYHPSAYSKTGWSNMVYCSSTQHIKVGRNWLKQNGYNA